MFVLQRKMQLLKKKNKASLLQLSNITYTNTHNLAKAKITQTNMFYDLKVIKIETKSKKTNTLGTNYCPIYFAYTGYF